MSKQNTFRDLKASFETRSKPTTATASSTAYRSVAGDLANMSTYPSNRSARVPSLAKSIDSVLDTPPASSPVRPLAKLRPSWIGPLPQERPTTPGVQAMKQAVTVYYSSPGLQPPVYILTSLSDPQWEAIEMHREQDEHGSNVFSKVFHVEEGDYQYKFRLGEGDWWVCDESKPTVDDGQGNKNNLLAVKAQPLLMKMEQPKSEQKHDSSPPLQSEQSKAEPKHDSPPSKEVKPAPKIEAITPPKPDTQHQAKTTSTHTGSPSPVALMKQDASKPDDAKHSKELMDVEEFDPIISGAEEVDDHHSPPLMKHETLNIDAKRQQAPEADEDEDEDDSSSSSSSSKEDDEEKTAPLLRHETLTPSSSAKQEHAPLFRHESIGGGNNHHEPVARNVIPIKTPNKSVKSSPIPAEADPHDHTLERFPTAHHEIMDMLGHIQKHLPEDETLHDHSGHSPTSEALSESSTSPRSLHSRRDSGELALEKIREAEEEEVEKEEADGDELDPLRAATPGMHSMAHREPEDADFEPKVEIEEHIVIEIVDQRRSAVETLIDKIGGRGNAIAVAVGLLVIAAGICSMQFL